jgi:hypothetical protein
MTTKQRIKQLENRIEAEPVTIRVGIISEDGQTVDTGGETITRAEWNKLCEGKTVMQIPANC